MSGSGQVRVGRPSENGTEFMSSIKSGEDFEELSDCQLLKKVHI